MYKDLYIAIVIQAIQDWKRLIRENKRVIHIHGETISFTELRRFFRSDYCELLLQDTKISACEILKKLEEEKRESNKR